MEVSGISAPSSANAALLSKFQLGERLLVEVMNISDKGEGTIRVKGQSLNALLETSTQVGEKFWVKVGNLNEGGLLLIREPIPGKLKDSFSVPPQVQQINERGLPNNQTIVALVKNFPTTPLEVFSALFGSMQGTAFNNELLTYLKKAIPQWSSLSGDNGKDELLKSLKKLGLNYEHRIHNMLKLDQPAKEIEKQSLLDTFKGVLLKAIQSQNNEDRNDSDNPLVQMLQKITGQQLWLKTGALDSAYLILHLPLLNHEQLIPAQIAIESSRKGSKMDENHCRIAILVQTQELGEIGIDAFFNEKNFTCKVLSDDSLLPRLLEAAIPETKEKFIKLGFQLERVESGELRQNLEFRNFLHGSRRSGVDILR
ncbi:hypothetical protein DP73_08815 [Desulfosporosinus sp. HMP52]|uniref:hypothetical protein n=1 Tax=Desulfosporosinus sp. HMP52 TaxID=1487923 RepID=UPI00051FED35|nr:hypothetical protein [Desulfosporosinus sp. HMP52]KGK89727.1 hypothetical protein DP73_08815 [Desulfosporosinus sp. HMP52]